MEPSSAEPLLTFREAIEYLRQNHGRAASYSSLRRWQAKGCRESRGVRLQVQRFGARWVTRGSWLDEFITACNQPGIQNPPAAPMIDPRQFKDEEDRQYLLSKGYGRSRRWRRNTED